MCKLEGHQKCIVYFPSAVVRALSARALSVRALSAAQTQPRYRVCADIEKLLFPHNATSHWLKATSTLTATQRAADIEQAAPLRLFLSPLQWPRYSITRSLCGRYSWLRVGSGTSLRNGSSLGALHLV